MNAMKPHLYVNSRGYLVTRHSYSGSDSFHYCARKYYLERVQGWAEKQQRAASQFGIAIEAAVKYWHQRGQDTNAAVAEFVRLWAEHKDPEPTKEEPNPKPRYVYSKPEKDWESLNQSGQEMIRLYTILYPTFPYTVKDPAHSFQVETNFEVFPGSKLAGIEFTSYIDLLAEVENRPDGEWRDYTKSYDKEPIIIDMKTSGKDVPEFTVLDPQLRSYSWVKGLQNVAFLWFRKMGRSVSRGDWGTMLFPYAGLTPGTEVLVMATDDFGAWVTTDEKAYDEMSEKFIGEAKAVKLARQAFVEGKSVHVVESSFTKQRVQFKAAVIDAESAEDIGRAIKKDIIDIAAATEKEFFPMQGGVRFPNEKCTMCAMRGICANRPDLRDSLLVRKQLDEFDFGKESE